MAPVIKHSREELLAQRRALEEAVGMSAAELKEYHRTHSLSGEQWEALWAIQDLDFLLGESE
ncbi:hypothetical protein [Microbacterium sp. KNMS]